MKSLQDIYPDNWKNHINPIHTYEGSAISLLRKAGLMPTLSNAQEFVFRLPGASWEPPKEFFEAAIGQGWAEFCPHTGNVLGQKLTQEGWEERKRIYKELRALCKRTKVKKEPGWEDIPGHMMVA